ncbi:MAG: hypothetical protein IPH20_20555 [Bacteroidales bacterium]|nr:hypothetical protein [Bacteroidales bacterium]
MKTGLIAQETGSFTDLRDGKVYKTVKTGDQWIMAENFAFKPDQGNYWAYNNNPANAAIFGYLYDWETANKIAPAGWHLPSEKEWKTFRKSMGAGWDTWSTMKKVYKQMVTGGSSGFNALFGGAYIISDKEFRGLNEVAYFWSSTRASDGQPVNYILERESGEAFITSYADPKGGKSVRYFKDKKE